jgi:hypothetical protein
MQSNSLEPDIAQDTRESEVIVEPVTVIHHI